MGVLNVTPDSFSDGGRYLEPAAAVAHADRMVAAGASIIDVGGASTRPGSVALEAGAEISRVVPVIEAIRESHDVDISIDTSQPAVIEAAVAAGATMINDVRALRVDGALQAAASLGVPVCLMHMQGEPATMQINPTYGDVVVEVREFLLARVDACVAGGIDSARLIVDPGFGFGKRSQHNLRLLAELDSLVATGLPVLAGLSRKSTIGQLLGREVGERLPASIVLAVIAARRGASIIRAHDVAETLDALTVDYLVSRADTRQ